MIEHETNGAGIQVELSPQGTPGYVAIVRLDGEHDLATSEQLRAELAPIDGHILVDLSTCEFIDSTVISILLSSHQERDREGHRLDLLLPPENSQVSRTIEIVGVRQLLVVLTERP